MPFLDGSFCLKNHFFKKFFSYIFFFRPLNPTFPDSGKNWEEKA